MKPEKMFSVIALALSAGAWIVAVIAAADYLQITKSASWPQFTGKVTRVTEIAAPLSIHAFRGVRYLEVEYRVENANGIEVRGVAQSPFRDAIVVGETLQVRVDPDRPGRSTPEPWRDAYRAEQAYTALAALLAGLGLLWVARALWKQADPVPAWMEALDRRDQR